MLLLTLCNRHGVITKFSCVEGKLLMVIKSFQESTKVVHLKCFDLYDMYDYALHLCACMYVRMYINILKYT